ncbi:MAG: flippase activity-associated protein Agl23 [Haloglomus sp.]
MDVPVPDSLHRWQRDRTAIAVAALALGALLVRLVDLGYRTAQYDEGWVGYWILRYVETGAWEYRPLVHGPFLPHINRWVFTLLGANDFTARLVVAVLGGLLPLTALLFRDRLGRVEVLALGALLASNPILLYYSRFMRFDFPLAACMFAGLGFLVRALDRSDPRYLYPAGGSVALGMTTKESWILYFVAWVGAAAFALDTRLLSGSGSEVDRLRALPGRVLCRLWRWRRSIFGAAIVWLVVLVFFYAPRSGSTDEPGLWRAFGDPGLFPTVLSAATIGSARKLYDFWVSGGLQKHPYIPYLQDYLATMWEGAFVVVVFAVLGFLVDRYAVGEPRSLVTFAFVWGVLKVVGYPLANFLQTPWSTVHAVVPLAIPAAVGIAVVYRLGRAAWERDRKSVAAVAIAVLVLAAGASAATAVRTSYIAPQDGDSELVYLSQAESDIKPTLGVVELAVENNEGLDVLYYGAAWNISSESIADRPPAYGGWHARLPLPWYLEAMEANRTSSARVAALQGENPPVVITKVEYAPVVAARLGDGYWTSTLNLTQIDKRTVFFVRRSATRE